MFVVTPENIAELSHLQGLKSIGDIIAERTPSNVIDFAAAKRRAEQSPPDPKVA